jgi:hypothetical protein
MAEWTNEQMNVVVSTVFEFITYPITCKEILSGESKKKLWSLIEQKGGYGERSWKTIEPLVKNALAYITDGQYNFSLGARKLREVVDRYSFSYDSDTKLITVEK